MLNYEDIILLLEKEENLTQEEEFLIFDFYHKNGKIKEIKDKMILKNKRLIHYVAKRYTVTTLDYEEIIQEGYLGLIKAFDLFDYTKDYKFATYAIHWIRAFIGRYIGNHGRTIRMPSYLLEKYVKINAIQTSYFNKHGEMPDEEYLAKKLETTPENILRILHLAKVTNPLSLNKTIDTEDDEVSFFNIVEDKNSKDVFEEFFLKETEHVVWPYIKNILDEREYDVLKRRMGVGGTVETLEMIGESYGVSRERIRQIEKRALQKISVEQHKQFLSAYL